MGYIVKPDVDYARSVIFELDDWGTADKGFLSYWRYLEPGEKTIKQYLIAPLRKHHGVASAEVITGYIDRKSKRIAVPWKQNFIDRYGLHQDYASTRQGLEDAVAAGVLEIESHGWTHMEPDLESPPGPWWTASLGGEASVDGWYSEFSDQRRDKEIPAITQIFHMERSLAELQQDFGAQPLELKPGGAAWSRSQFNNTAGVAAQVGFGLFHSDTVSYFLDHTLVLDMDGVVPDISTGYDELAALHPARWPDHPDGPVILGFHDRDIALDHNFLEQLFSDLPANYKAMAENRYIGLLHTRISSSSNGKVWQLAFAFDRHYCAYFRKHPSSWRLWLSPSLWKQLSVSLLEVSVDGKPPTKLQAAYLPQKSITFDLPAGVGAHTWRLEATGNGEQP